MSRDFFSITKLTYCSFSVNFLDDSHSAHWTLTLNIFVCLDQKGTAFASEDQIVILGSQCSELRKTEATSSSECQAHPSFKAQQAQCPGVTGKCFMDQRGSHLHFKYQYHCFDIYLS